MTLEGCGFCANGLRVMGEIGELHGAYCSCVYGEARRLRDSDERARQIAEGGDASVHRPLVVGPENQSVSGAGSGTDHRLGLTPDTVCSYCGDARYRNKPCDTCGKG